MFPYVVIAIIFLVILILGICIFNIYNGLVKLKLKTHQSKSAIDVYCQQRFDLIPNLVEVVKNYKKYEENVFTNIAELRTQYNKTKDISIGQELNTKLNTIISVVENYPELKASEQFLNLQKNLEKMESQLQAARRIYNNDVTKYNTKIATVPHNMIAKIFKFSPEPLFKVDNPEVKENIQIKDI